MITYHVSLVRHYIQKERYIFICKNENGHGEKMKEPLEGARRNFKCSDLQRWIFPPKQCNSTISVPLTMTGLIVYVSSLLDKYDF